MELEELKNKNPIMSEEYWKLWNSDLQEKIDRDIETNRKADASIRLENIPEGSEVKVEQLTHSFIFGAHIFNYDQLGTDERNAKYKELYGSLFNSATIPFYWKKFELDEGSPRFKGEKRDTADFWNSVEDPKNEPHWRRPATDPVVEFCESKGIRLHGHTLVWGNSKWNIPEWLMSKLPSPYRERVVSSMYAENTDRNKSTKMFESYSLAEIEALLPEFTRDIHTQMMKRIMEIALYYKQRIHSWDIVNESSIDFGNGCMIPGDGICKSHYGLMPGDYAYRAFKIADSFFQKEIKLNINDYNLQECYPEQVEDLVDRGCKIDILGAQMHLFDPQTCQDIADGKCDRQSPADVDWIMNCITKTGLPIHLSEITITAPNNDERGQAIQAIITRNLYRRWFSEKDMMGITWWNVVDDCGAPGEPSSSGLFSRDMKPKTVYFMMNDLINNEWKTNMTVNAAANGLVEFRGFRGKYRLSWTDTLGVKQTVEYELA